MLFTNLLKTNENPFPSLQRPPSSSLSYSGAVNDDVRSPGAGSTPGPLSQQQPQGLDTSDPGKSPEPSDCHKTLRYAGKFSHKKTIIIVVRLAVQQVVLGYIIFRRGSVRWKLFMGHWIKMTVEITTCWLNYVG